MAITYNATAPTFNLKEIGSEDIKNGIEAQAASETLRRKKALADAFSKSIVTEIQKDAAGEIIARPGDIDEQKYYKLIAGHGLSFEEGKAVRDDYVDKKNKALETVKTGLAIKQLGGEAFVPSRAGAPIVKSAEKKNIFQPQPDNNVVPAVVEEKKPSIALELEGKTDFEKVNKLQEWLDSKKAEKVRAAQEVIGTQVDGRVGRDTKTAFGMWKDKLIKENLSKDVTTGAQNRIDVLADRVSKGEEGKLPIGDVFDTQPPKAGTLPREDTRTYQQVIEDRAGQNNFGQDLKSGFEIEVPKLDDFAEYKDNVSSVLKKAGLPNNDLGVSEYLKRVEAGVGDFVYDTNKSPSENQLLANKNKADKSKAVNDGIEKLSQGIDVVKGQILAKESADRSAIDFKNKQDSMKDLKAEGYRISSPDQVSKVMEIKQANANLDEAVKEGKALSKKVRSRKIDADALGVEWDVLINKFSKAAGATTEGMRGGVAATDFIRKDEELGKLIKQHGVKEGTKKWITSQLSNNTPDKVADLLDLIIMTEDKTSQARTDRKSWMKSGAEKGLSKGLGGPKSGKEIVRKPGESRSAYIARGGK